MRYALTDCEWFAIRPMLPNKPRGVPVDVARALVGQPVGTKVTMQANESRGLARHRGASLESRKRADSLSPLEVSYRAIRSDLRRTAQ